MASYIKDGRLEIIKKSKESRKLIIEMSLVVIIIGGVGIFANFDWLVPESHAKAMLFKALCIIPSALMAVMIVFYAKTTGRSGPFLIADRNGLTEFSNGSSLCKLIPWSDIKRIYTNSVSAVGASVPYIFVELYDTEAYLDKLNAVQRKVAEANMAMGYPAVYIGFINVDENIDDVYNDLLTLWGESGADTGEN